MALKVVSEAKKKESPSKPIVKAVKVEKPAKAEKPLKAVKSDEKSAKAEVVKAEVLPAEKKASPEGLLGETREAYKSYQRSWFRFAQKVTEVQRSGAWAEGGYDTFKDYCLAEFADITYPTMVKFVKVIESMGPALEKRLTTVPEKALPGYTTCYELLLVQDKLPKDEVPKIRKNVIEGKLTREEVQQAAEPYVKKAEKKAEKNRIAEAKKIDRAVEKDVKATAKGKALQVVAPPEAAKAEPVDVEGDLESNVEEQIQQLLERVTYINDNLPLVTSAIEKSSVRVVKLAEALEKLVEYSDKYLDKASDVPVK